MINTHTPRMFYFSIQLELQFVLLKRFIFIKLKLLHNFDIIVRLIENREKKQCNLCEAVQLNVELYSV